MQLINPSTSPNELNTTLTPHSIIHGDACFAYFNKIWGIPQDGVPLDIALKLAAFDQSLGQVLLFISSTFTASP